MEESQDNIEKNVLTRSTPDSKTSESDSSFGSNKDLNVVSMPMCFLIKEQAKSSVAIQELRKRLDSVEFVQDDLVDAVIELRNFLSNSRNYSSATSVSLSALKCSPAYFNTQLNSGASPCLKTICTGVESTAHVPSSAAKRLNSPKDADNIFNDVGKIPSINEKHLDLNKKDSVLESDKQDSGLDSDCREHNEVHLSMTKNALKPECNDELLQLLDEISYRSEILQKQLAVVEEKAELNKDSQATPNESIGTNKMVSPNSLRSCALNATSVLQTSPKRTCPTQTDATLANSLVAERFPEKNVNSSTIVDMFEEKPISSRNPPKKRLNGGIDSVAVSSILKETSVVDLQRLALIYLTDNAVLHAKVREAEHIFSLKQTESDKVENSLKEEGRLLMMENRELRIAVDEQRMEINSLKNRLAMLERLLQSVSHENQELNVQLGESLNLQTLPQKGLLNYSSSYAFEPSNIKIKNPRRCSLPTKLSGGKDVSVSCVKSKLLSNTSSFLDITVEESEGELDEAVPKSRKGSAFSSTPMVPLQKLKSHRQGPPASFQVMKKCFKGNHLSVVSRTDTPEMSVKKSNFQPNVAADAETFPFQTILEKLRASSDYRLSKSISSKSRDSAECLIENQNVPAARACKPDVDGGENMESSYRNCPSSSGTDAGLQKRKTRNIQQRIQSILDRIVSESEDAS